MSTQNLKGTSMNSLIKQMMPICCIMGNAESSTFGDWPMLSANVLVIPIKKFLSIFSELLSLVWSGLGSVGKSWVFNSYQIICSLFNNSFFLLMVIHMQSPCTWINVLTVHHFLPNPIFSSSFTAKENDGPHPSYEMFQWGDKVIKRAF